MQVPAVRTPSSPQQFAAVLTALWPGIVGGTPTQDAVTMLATQIAVETSWTSIWNSNVGNLAGTAGDYVMLHASDGTYRPYRAFASLNDGVTAYLTLLNHRYSAALASASTGDVDGFASNLKTKGYYEEPEAQYAAAIQGRYASTARALNAPIVPTIPVPAPNWAFPIAVIGLLGGAAYYLSRPVRVPVRRRVSRRRAYA